MLNKKHTSKHYLKQIIFIISMSIAFVLTGCANRIDRNRMHRAELLFKNQDYHSAFQHVIALAKRNHPDAQYAAGYMLYYGKGVVENKPMALYWLHKAAGQGNPDAITALAEIERGHHS